MADVVFDCKEVFRTNEDFFENEEDRDTACMDFPEGGDNGADQPAVNQAYCEEEEAPDRLYTMGP